MTGGKASRGSSRFARYGIFVTVACLVALVPLVAIAPFDRPSADDFAYSVLTHAVLTGPDASLGALLGTAAKVSADAYATWQGLFVGSFLFSLQPGILGSQFYQLGAYAMMACMVFASLSLAYAVERHLFESRGRGWVPVGLLLATFMLQAMPRINEAVYWFNGAVNYTPWFCAAMVASACCITALRAAGRVQRGLMVAVAGVLVFLAGGCNYMPSLICIMATFGFAVLGVRVRRFSLSVPLVCALAGFLLNAMAPGTAARQAMFPDHPGVVSTLIHSAWRALMNVHSFADVTLFVTLLLAAPFIASWARGGAIRFSAKGLAAVAGLSFIALVGVNCVPFYATGSFGEGRTYNTCFELFCVCAFAVWTCLVGLAVQEGRSARSIAHRVGARLEGGVALPLAVAVVGVGLVVFWGGIDVAQQHGNSFTAARELANGTAAAYAAEYDAREVEIVAAGANGTAHVSELENRSEILFFSDVLGEYGDDWGAAMAQYYGVGDVVVEGANGESEDMTL